MLLKLKQTVVVHLRALLFIYLINLLFRVFIEKHKKKLCLEIFKMCKSVFFTHYK